MIHYVFSHYNDQIVYTETLSYHAVSAVHQRMCNEQ